MRYQLTTARFMLLLGLNRSAYNRLCIAMQLARKENASRKTRSLIIRAVNAMHDVVYP